jgi:hypothetical protein
MFLVCLLYRAASSVIFVMQTISRVVGVVSGFITRALKHNPAR